MKLVLIYLGIALLGYFAGSVLRKKDKKIKWADKVLTASIVILVVAMGIILGLSKELIPALGSIGVTASIITAATLTGSVAAVFLARKMLGINKKGLPADD